MADRATGSTRCRFGIACKSGGGILAGGPKAPIAAPILASRQSGSGIAINPSVGPTNSLLYASFAETNDTSFVTAFASPGNFASNITGIRLEAIELTTNGLPGFGPGTSSTGASGNTDGNFVLTEFNLFAAPLVNVPEPSTLALFGIALAGLGFVGYRRQRR